jgi:subtilase family serine protease
MSLRLTMRTSARIRRASQKEMRMSWKRRLAAGGTGIALGAATAMSMSGTALAAPAQHGQALIQPTFKIHRVGTRPNGTAQVTSTTPTGLSPSAIQSVYHLSGLSPTSKAGAGQIVAIVDAYSDPNALADLNVFNAQYGYPVLSTCSSLTQAGACFEVAQPSGKPVTNADWAVEESLDVQWAHAEAPGAKVVLVEAKSSSNANLYAAVTYANSIGATEVSMSWGGSETSSETSHDSLFTHAGTFYTASAGDSGHGVIYPSSSPNVISVGGTTLNGCSGTSCSGFTSETSWGDGGGGVSAFEPIPGYQSSYTGPVFKAATISALTGGKRGVPDISFDGSPSTGVSLYDSTAFEGQSGWWTVGGTSVGAPNWAGILAAGAAAGSTALQGNAKIYAGGYQTNLRDISSGTNGSCGTDCIAGAGYDLVTGLGSPINYP